MYLTSWWKLTLYNNKQVTTQTIFKVTVSRLRHFFAHIFCCILVFTSGTTHSKRRDGRYRKLFNNFIAKSLTIQQKLFRQYSTCYTWRYLNNRYFKLVYYSSTRIKIFTISFNGKLVRKLWHLTQTLSKLRPSIFICFYLVATCSNKILYLRANLIG